MAQNYDLNNTGQEVQERLDQVMPNKSDIEQEALDRQSGDNALQEQIDAINTEIGESGQGDETINGRLDFLNSVTGNKEYTPEDFSGLGRVNLGMNIIDGKNVLTQDMMPVAQTAGEEDPGRNTIYIIQYDYDLNGETVKVPEGSVLEFDGGSFQNGTVNFNSSIIRADKDIFGDNLFPIDDCVFYQDIKPYWFGAVGDGIHDDTDAWEKCLSFAEKVKAQNTFRNYTQTFGCISADRKSRFKITRPLTITFQADIIGGFDFYYYGSFPAFHTGIINFFGTFSQCTYEFNVVHAGTNPNNTGSSFYPNWSDITDASEYAGVVVGNESNPSTMEECLLTIRVNKCWIGIWAYGHNGSRYFSCNTFNRCKFFVCMYGFVNTFNGQSWNNDLKFFNCEYRPTGSGYSLPADFSQAAFIRVDGDAPERNMNATIIDGLSLEGKPVKGNVTALWIKKTNEIKDLRISNIRIENTGSPIIVSDGIFDNCLIDNMKALSGYHTVSVSGVTFNSRYVDLPGIEVIQGPYTHSELMLWNDEITAEMSSGLYRYATRPFIVFTNTSSISISDERKTKNINLKFAYLFSVEPGSVLQITTSKVRFQAKIFNENMTLCDDIPNTVLPVGNLSEYFYNGKLLGYVPGSALPTNVSSRFYFANIGEYPIYISVQDITNDYSHINLSFKMMPGASAAERYYYKKQGTTLERPPLMGYYLTTEGDVGFKYFDKSINNEVEWNEASWVLPNGYSSYKVSGSTSERPQLDFYNDGFAYFDTDLNKKIIAKISNQVLYEEIVPKKEERVIQNTLDGGKSYWIGYSAKHSFGGIVAFRKVQDSEDGQIVLLPNYNTSSLGRYFSAPDPNVYPYIYLYNNHSSITETISFNVPHTNWLEEDGASAGVLRSGDTSSRPVGSDIYVGFEYFDTSVGKPVYAAAIGGAPDYGVTWKDASGNVV